MINQVQDATFLPVAANDNVGDTALLVIDVQSEFCDPEGRRGNAETETVAARIASLVPEFRKAGIPVYAVYFDREKNRHPEQVDFYKFNLDPSDIPVAKNKDSAFAGSDIAEILKRNGHKRLLTCGFNLKACVFSTVVDARAEGFDVELLKDITGNDNYNTGNSEWALDMMKEKGVTFTDSGAVLQSAFASQPNQAPRMGF